MTAFRYRCSFSWKTLHEKLALKSEEGAHRHPDGLSPGSMLSEHAVVVSTDPLTHYLSPAPSSIQYYIILYIPGYIYIYIYMIPLLHTLVLLISFASFRRSMEYRIGSLTASFAKRSAFALVRRARFIYGSREFANESASDTERERRRLASPRVTIG